MAVQLYYHPIFLEHDPGPNHPERADRLRAIVDILETHHFDGLVRCEAPEVSLKQMCRVHPRYHVDQLLAASPAVGRVVIDADTVMSPGSGEAALRAAGAVCAAVDAVMEGDAKRAFCAVRPPGHHAEPTRSMGFCLFNNVAVGARHALGEHGLGRVAIVDFDVHHGNGTAAAFADEPAVMFGSTHQMRLYPGTGGVADVGVGNLVNMLLPPGASGSHFRAAWGRFLPLMVKFQPELILMSAGFDGHRADPLAQLQLSEQDYKWITQEVVKAAEQCCSGRVVSTLEGGYEPQALATSVAAHIGALMAE